MGYGLIVGVLVLHLKRNGLSDSSSKAYVVHMVLTITVKWYKVDELIPDTSFYLFLFSKYKNKKSNSLVELGNDKVVLTFFWLNYGTTKQWSRVFGFTWRASFLTSRGGSCLRKVRRPLMLPN